MSLVENWGSSIALCQHLLIVFEKKVRLLQLTVDHFNDDSMQPFKKYEDFYNSFQEAYDLYFFLYLGHFLRAEHYHRQKNETLNDNNFKALHPYKVYQYQKGKLTKILSEGNKFWKHCISYLVEAL
jgi:hypothetical protein